MKAVGLNRIRIPHREALPPSCIFARTTGSARCSTCVGFPDQAQSRPSSRVVPHDPGPRARRVRAAGGLASQHLPQFAELPTACCAQRYARLALWRADHGCEGLCESGPIGLPAGRFAAAERVCEASARSPAQPGHGALIAHDHRRDVDTIDAGRLSFQPMNVNFGPGPAAGKIARAAAPMANGCAAPKIRWPSDAL